MNSSFTSTLFSTMVGQISKYVNFIYGPIMETFMPLAVAITTLYIVIIGYMLMTGKFKSLDQTIEFTVSLVVMIVIASLIFGSDAYFQWIVKPFTTTTFNLASFFTAKAGNFDFSVSDMFGALDAMMGKVMTTIDRISSDGSFWASFSAKFKTIVATFLLAVCYGGVYMTYLYLMISSFFALQVMFVVGGVCMFFASFKKTRFITWAWVRAIFNYSLVMVFASIVLSICIFGLSNAVDRIAEADPAQGVFTVEFAGALCWAILTILFLFKSTEFAGALSGGSPSSSGGLAGAAGAAGGAAISGLNAGGAKAAPYLAQGAKTAAPYMNPARAYSAMKDIIYK